MRVLVMEDNWLIANAITDVLQNAGMSVVGPVADLTHGIALARSAEIDGAVLDIQLVDGNCFAAATILRLRGVPFIFLSGYQSSNLVPPVFRAIPYLQKPEGIQELPAAIERTFRDGGTGALGSD
jgi:DNA-binding response OmpR family regulator